MTLRFKVKDDLFFESFKKYVYSLIHAGIIRDDDSSNFASPY